MRKPYTGLVYLLLLFISTPGWAEQIAFNKVKVRFNRSEKDRRLVDKDADVVFDDTERKLIVKNDQKPLSVGYDDIQKVVFDVSSHMRGGALSQVVGGLAGAAIAGKHVNDYWCHLEYRKKEGGTQVYMLEIDKDSADKMIEKMKSLLADKVSVADFGEKDEKIDKNTLKDLQSKHELKVDPKSHPAPEIKPDKALLVVVCPPLAARYSGKGNQFKLHANDQVVAVNKMGTYSLAYLDPGEYLLASQSENASGFRMKLEAGKDYYVMQNVFMGAWKARTSLSRQTKELALYEMSGTHYAAWKRK